MTRRMIAFIFALLGASLGSSYLPYVWDLIGLREVAWIQSPVVNSVIGIIIFLFLALLLMNRIVSLLNKVKERLFSISVHYLVFGIGGLVAGLIAAWLISIPLAALQIPAVSQYFPIILSVSFGYFGGYVGIARMDELKKVFNFQRKKQEDKASVLDRKEGEVRKYKLLDTSVIIDGRIYDVAKTGFIEGILVIPVFVLHELQLIADSSDHLKRARGRRGLDILNMLQKEAGIRIESYDGDYDDIHEVDSKLVRLAKKIDAIIVTNDYNLNKVCEFQNVPVLNINALANAVKPVVIPGETMNVTVVKAGTERQQGVAYLEDGTMIVVEDGQFYMNEVLEVVVTSALQTAAGRMIFAKPAHSQRKLGEM